MSASAKGPRKRTRESEIKLLQQISSSLDAFTGTAGPAVSPQKEWLAKKKRVTGAKTTTNFLVVKTVVKGIVRACVEEKVPLENENKSVGVVDSLIEEYRLKYPKLTKQMVTDAMARHKKSQENENATDELEGKGDAKEKEDGGDDNDGTKLSRCMEIVEDEIAGYHEKIEALKKKRELAASQPYEPERRIRRGRPRKNASEGEDGDDGDDGEPKEKRPRGRPRKHHPGEEPDGPPRARGRPRKNTPETALIREITERYAREREGLDRLRNGAFETIVEETKKDFGMEDFELSLDRIRKRVTWNFMHRRESGEGFIARKAKRDVYEDVYQRYAKAKISNGGKLPPGTLPDIIEAVKLEYGASDVRMGTLETKVQTRFRKEHPEFKSTPEGVLDIGTLTEEQKRNRQVLLNEITLRYVRRKEESSEKRLPDGELDRIIEDAKTDLNIHDFDVPKNTIRGRIDRKSHAVMTLGKNSPYDAIDEPLVKTINAWLGQGVSVTRAQGLEFANTLLKGDNTDAAAKLDEEGNEIFLDAKWWRNFLDRNKKKLVCAQEE